MKRIIFRSIPFALFLFSMMSSGCVERTYMIRTKPAGALVYVDGKLIGPSPVSSKFVYYGKRKIKIVKEGFEPLEVIEDFDRPWYQYPFIDFAFEHLIPVHWNDRRDLAYELKPKRHVRTDELLNRARNQRAIGKTIGDAPPAGELIPIPPPPPEIR